MKNNGKEPTDVQKLRFITRRLNTGHFLPTPTDIDRIKELSAARMRSNPERQGEQRPSSPKEARTDAINRLYDMAKRGLVHSEIAFCMIDVLGFSSLLESPTDAFTLYQDVIIPLIETRDTELENAVKMLSIPFEKERRRPRRDLSDLPRLEALFFSDTIVLYPAFTSKVPPVYREPAIQVWLLAEAARNLIMNFLGRRLLIRGSIGYGECLLTRDPICYLGRTIIEVHSIEACQNWGGIALAPSAAISMDRFKKLPREFCRYRVPWKTTPAAQETLRRYPYRNAIEEYVIDWSFYGLCNDNVIPWLEEQARAGATPQIRDLYANTAAFYRARREATEVPRA